MTELCWCGEKDWGAVPHLRAWAVTILLLLMSLRKALRSYTIGAGHRGLREWGMAHRRPREDVLHLTPARTSCIRSPSLLTSEGSRNQDCSDVRDCSETPLKACGCVLV